MPKLMTVGPDDGPLLLLAHGAGAGMASPFMAQVADLLALRGIATARFEFGYMAARTRDGKRRPPPRAEALVPEYLGAIARVSERWPARPLLIGGKSMGGRVASYVAAEPGTRGFCRGLVCLGYPFHPPHKPTQLRTSHLTALEVPALFIQGERDPFGSRAEVADYALPAVIRLHWAGDGDHDLGPRGGSGFTRKGNLAAAADAITLFAAGLS